MKLPKLKYYYYAMTSDAYIDFAVRRQLEVSPTLTIDVLTGTVSGRTQLILGAQTILVDEYFRAQHKNYAQPLYVLRISHTCIDRKHLKPIAPDLFSYSQTLTIDHCGVERIELAAQPVGPILSKQ
jgi:hypothetical protein